MAHGGSIQPKFPWQRVLNTGVDVAGPLLEGRAQGRAQENYEQREQDKLTIPMAQLNLRMPQVRAGHAALGDVMANVQDYTLSGSGRDLVGTGGLRPSLLGEASRGVGSQIAREALIAQMGGTVRKPVKVFGRERMVPFTQPSGIYAPLKPTPLKRPGKWDKVLGGVKIGASILGKFLGG